MSENCILLTLFRTSVDNLWITFVPGEVLNFRRKTVEERRGCRARVRVDIHDVVN